MQEGRGKDGACTVEFKPDGDEGHEGLYEDKLQRAVFATAQKLKEGPEGGKEGSEGRKKRKGKEKKGRRRSQEGRQEGYVLRKRGLEGSKER
jgi:hypothetical protein